MWLATLASPLRSLILRFVRPTFRRIIVAITCLVVGVLISCFRRPPVQPSSVAAPAAAAPAAPSQVSEDDDETLLEHLELRPYVIYYFLQRHPGATFTRLWQRLGVTNDPDVGFNADQPSASEVNIFEYDLDNDATREIVLQIKQQYAYRYLIFGGAEKEAKLIGHFDVHAKYPPSDPVVFLSNGRAWLVVQETAATGSGLAAWADTVYEVRNGRVRTVASYLSHVRQFGEPGFPTKEFIARPLSCEIRNGRAVLTVSYRVEYMEYSPDDPPLFTKQQNAVLISSLRDGSTLLDASRSDMTAREFETIYNFDSESRDDFLQYNRAELRAIARGHDAKKKRWLKEFFENSRNEQ